MMGMTLEESCILLRMAVHHVNFHTLGSVPIFEDTGYGAMMRATIPQVIRLRRIVCLAWELMPSHVHLLIQDFPDYPRSRILQHLKGDTSRAILMPIPTCALIC